MEKQNSRIRILSDLIIPVLLCVPMLMTGFKQNYSGIAAMKLPVFYACLIPVMIYTVCMTYRIAGKHHELILWAVYIAAFLLTLIVPYHVPEDIFSHLHLVFAYGSFIAFNIMILKIFITDPKLMSAYLAICVLSGLVCLTDGTVNGPAELIYAISISVLLARI